MELERVLKLAKYCENDKEILEMIISNRTDHSLGGRGCAVSGKNFGLIVVTWTKND